MATSEITILKCDEGTNMMILLTTLFSTMAIKSMSSKVVNIQRKPTTRRRIKAVGLSVDIPTTQIVQEEAIEFAYRIEGYSVPKYVALKNGAHLAITDDPLSHVEFINNNNQLKVMVNGQLQPDSSNKITGTQTAFQILQERNDYNMDTVRTSLGLKLDKSIEDVIYLELKNNSKFVSDNGLFKVVAQLVEQDGVVDMVLVFENDLKCLVKGSIVFDIWMPFTTGELGTVICLEGNDVVNHPEIAVEYVIE